jgi:hypothetical protein
MSQNSHPHSTGQHEDAPEHVGDAGQDAAVGAGDHVSPVAPDLLARGMAVLRQIGGRDFDGPVKRLAQVSPDMADFTVAYPYGDILSRPGLDLRTRQVCTVSCLVAQGSAQSQLRFHMDGLLNVGGRPEDLVDIMFLSTACWDFRRPSTPSGSSGRSCPTARSHSPRFEFVDLVRRFYCHTGMSMPLHFARAGVLVTEILVIFDSGRSFGSWHPVQFDGFSQLLINIMPQVNELQPSPASRASTAACIAISARACPCIAVFPHRIAEGKGACHLLVRMKEAAGHAAAPGGRYESSQLIGSGTRAGEHPAVYDEILFADGGSAEVAL